MTSLTRLRKQVTFDLLIFRRNPAAAFFTVVLPLIFLFIFTGIFGNEEFDGFCLALSYFKLGFCHIVAIDNAAGNFEITFNEHQVIVMHSSSDRCIHLPYHYW